MKFTMVPAWLIAWGTTMVIISNMRITNWPLFIVELYVSMLLGIFFIAYGSNIFSAVMRKIMPKQKVKPGDKTPDEGSQTH